MTATISLTIEIGINFSDAAIRVLRDLRLFSREFHGSSELRKLLRKSLSSSLTLRQAKTRSRARR